MSQIRIDVNGFKVRKNKEEGLDECCIRIDDGKNKWYARKVKILGPSEIIQSDYDPEHPNTPFIWIETEAPLEWEK